MISNNQFNLIKYLAEKARDVNKNGANNRIPSLTELGKEQGVSISYLREQLGVARTLGFVEVRPKTGINILPYRFGPAVNAGLEYAIRLDRNLFYKFADLLVLSSKWEGLPNVVLEALYLQTPVVVTDCIPYFYKLIHEGKNGYVVKYGDEDDMADKIQKFQNLNVEKDFLNLPNYNKIFWEMIHN